MTKTEAPVLNEHRDAPQPKPQREAAIGAQPAAGTKTTDEEEQQRFYVTTPIYYVNDRPHIGNAYTTIAADAIARYHRQQGRDVFFLTGTDEHGINNERAARARGIAPQAHADELASAFKAAWRTLDVGYDRFLRTTEPAHRRSALELWRRLRDSGDLYRAVYSGAYCPSCEAYYQDDELDGGNCPIHRRPCEREEEENTFFRLSRYQEPLERLVRDSGFVQPEVRRNEVLGVLRQGLRDFSVTRRNVRWGIPAPDAPGEVLYVWVDALANYLTGVGFPDDEATFRRYWPADVHLVGKDIIRFHCLYWPALLLSARLPLPRRVFAHGWLTRGGQKISKSTGNTVDPVALAAEFGADAVRYYFLRAVPFGQDGDYTPAAFAARYNAELANDFGNLIQRATSLVARYAAGVVPAPAAAGDAEARLLAAAEALPAQVADAYARLALDAAGGAVCSFVTTANRYAEETAPWHLARQSAAGAGAQATTGATTGSAGEAPQRRLATSLYHLAEAARLAAWYLWPFIPQAAAEAHRRLSGREPVPGLGTFGALVPGTTVRTGAALFPRVESGKQVD
jgi:methionyl-tRNA synthetase